MRGSSSSIRRYTHSKVLLVGGEGEGVEGVERPPEILPVEGSSLSATRRTPSTSDRMASLFTMRGREEGVREWEDDEGRGTEGESYSLERRVVGRDSKFKSGGNIDWNWQIERESSPQKNRSRRGRRGCS